MSVTGSKIGLAPIYPVVAVDDLNRAVSFYRDKLGLQVDVDPDLPGYAVVQAGNSSHLLLYKSAYSRGETTLAVFEIDDVEGTVEELRQRGVRFEEYDTPGMKTVNGILTDQSGFKSAWFKDSEGNTIAIGQPVSYMIKRKAA